MRHFWKSWNKKTTAPIWSSLSYNIFKSTSLFHDIHLGQPLCCLFGFMQYQYILVGCKIVELQKLHWWTQLARCQLLKLNNFGIRIEPLNNKKLFSGLISKKQMWMSLGFRSLNYVLLWCILRGLVLQSCPRLDSQYQDQLKNV